MKVGERQGSGESGWWSLASYPRLYCQDVLISGLHH